MNYLLIFFFLFWPPFLLAAAIQVTPIRIHLNETMPIATLTLVNKASTPIMLETQSTHWTQKSGEDVYTPTKALIVSPPIISLEPGKSQLVRVALRHQEVLTEEDAFRIFVQEIPQYHVGNAPGVEFALRFGIPAFIAPIHPTYSLEWHTAVKKGMLKLKVINNSNTHIQFTHLDLINPESQKLLDSQSVFIYLLPHQSKTWEFKLKTFPHNALLIHAATDHGPVSTTITL